MTDVIAHRVVRLGPASASPLDYEYEVVADPALPADPSTPFVFRAVRADGVVLEQWLVTSGDSYSRRLDQPLIEPEFVSIPVRADYEYQQRAGAEWRTLARFWSPPRTDRGA